MTTTQQMVDAFEANIREQLNGYIDLVFMTGDARVTISSLFTGKIVKLRILNEYVLVYQSTTGEVWDDGPENTDYRYPDVRRAWRKINLADPTCIDQVVQCVKVRYQLSHLMRTKNLPKDEITGLYYRPPMERNQPYFRP